MNNHIMICDVNKIIDLPEIILNPNGSRIVPSESMARLPYCIAWVVRPRTTDSELARYVYYNYSNLLYVPLSALSINYKLV